MAEGSNKRLLKELQVFTTNPPVGISAGPNGDNVLEWQATIMGPADTPFKGGVFALNLSFKGDYPFKPPVVKFTTKIYHPNVNDDGSICLGLIKSDAWKPATRVVDVLNEIVELLKSPNPDDPLKADIAEQYVKDKAAFEKTAAEWTRKYAA
ncbi:hypothetical protein MP638_003256 [Amoeboaphelidium occidentale]|nr:hypothetical protein MP638_003256 [Amoeboaphelidium occidentale]